MADILFNEYVPELRLDTHAKQKEFLFYGIYDGKKSNDKQIPLLIASSFMYTIWRFKLSKRAPKRRPFLMQFFSVLHDIFASSNKLNAMINNYDLFICRNWDNLKHWRG